MAPEVADLLQKLNLRAEEDGVADFRDEENAGKEAEVVWALLGKVLSPTPSMYPQFARQCCRCGVIHMG
jgi:hypothetical protein